jgi:hypothetical protein
MAAIKLQGENCGSKKRRHWIGDDASCMEMGPDHEGALCQGIENLSFGQWGAAKKLEWEYNIIIFHF